MTDEPVNPTEREDLPCGRCGRRPPFRSAYHSAFDPCCVPCAAELREDFDARLRYIRRGW